MCNTFMGRLILALKTKRRSAKKTAQTDGTRAGERARLLHREQMPDRLGCGQSRAVVVNKAHRPNKRPFPEGVSVNQTAGVSQNARRVVVSAGNPALVYLLVLQLAFLPAVARAGAHSQDPQREPLGSLTIVGEARVNDAQPPAESTIFSGDTLRTAQNGTATFSTSGKGSVKIFPESLVGFPGNSQYVADLKSGMVVMSSLSGSTGINLRAGKYIVTGVTEGEQSTSKIEAALDGSFLISCLDGSVGVIPLDGANGLFIQAGQFVTISPAGVLTAVEKPPAPSTAPAPAAPTSQPSAKNNSHIGWILLAVAGGGGAAIAAAKAGGGGGSSPVSPSQ
jgi:hypothetical protein